MFSQLDLRRMSRITRLLFRQLGNFLGPLSRILHMKDAFRDGHGWVKSLTSPHGHAELHHRHAAKSVPQLRLVMQPAVKCQGPEAGCAQLS